jgi:hypothetical protein
MTWHRLSDTTELHITVMNSMRRSAFAWHGQRRASASASSFLNHPTSATYCAMYGFSPVLWEKLSSVAHDTDLVFTFFEHSSIKLTYML